MSIPPLLEVILAADKLERFELRITAALRRIDRIELAVILEGDGAASTVVVLPHVIFLPDASRPMLPAAGSGASSRYFARR